MFIYTHVPFCLSHCIYCDFYVQLEKYGGKTGFMDSLLNEFTQRLKMQQVIPAEGHHALDSLYVGGGTPSLLQASELRRLIQAVLKYTELTALSELTLEANPGAMKDSPERYLDIGFNRVSVGVQSFNNTELRRLSRIHRAEDAVVFIKNLKTAGFENISIDLMYGLPDQTLDSWRQTLEQTLKLDVSHVSMYGLKVEEGTPLERLVAMGAYPMPNEETHVAMYFEGITMLKSAGFEHYEFSNFARSGCVSRHNLNYWDNGEFLALGPSAHGYMNEVRYETVRDLAGWKTNPLAGTRHKCSPKEQLENALIFGLRKRKGVHITELEMRHQINFHERYGHILKKYEAENCFHLKDGYLRLNLSAIPVSNALLAEFLD